MNDLTMLEASRVLADFAVKLSADDPNSTVKVKSEEFAGVTQQLAIRVLSRELSSNELASLRNVWTDAFKYYENNDADAFRYTTVGQQEPPARDWASQTAAWMTLASLLLNLDEAITRE